MATDMKTTIKVVSIVLISMIVAVGGLIAFIWPKEYWNRPVEDKNAPDGFYDCINRCECLGFKGGAWVGTTCFGLPYKCESMCRPLEPNNSTGS